MKQRIYDFKWHFLVGLFLLTIFIWYVVFKEDRGGVMTVAFLDVGQGDAIFIEAPNGNQILLDAGSNRKVLKSLGVVMPFYDRSIDLLALSHPHLDHFAGFLNIIGRYYVGGIISSGTLHKTSEFKILQNDIQAENIKNITLHRGMKIDMGDGVFLNVLSPDRDVTNADPHDGMLVMKLIYGNTSVLLTGDMEDDIENYLVALDGNPPSGELKSQVLKIGHHGSRTSTSQTFLGYVSPEYAIISSGAGNSYGHPHKETLDILERFEVKLFRTDTDGTVVLKSDGEEVRIFNDDNS